MTFVFGKGQWRIRKNNGFESYFGGILGMSL